MADRRRRCTRASRRFGHRSHASARPLIAWHRRPGSRRLVFPSPLRPYLSAPRRRRKRRCGCPNRTRTSGLPHRRRGIDRHCASSPVCCRVRNFARPRRRRAWNPGWKFHCRRVRRLPFRRLRSRRSSRRRKCRRPRLPPGLRIERHRPRPRSRPHDPSPVRRWQRRRKRRRGMRSFRHHPQPWCVNGPLTKRPRQICRDRRCARRCRSHPLRRDSTRPRFAPMSRPRAFQCDRRSRRSIRRRLLKRSRCPVHPPVPRCPRRDPWRPRRCGVRMCRSCPRLLR